MSNIQLSCKSDEWYTPTYLIDLVKQVIPHIDLDPASSVRANSYIDAAKIFTRKDDSLNQCWGTLPTSIYLNPPGGKIGNKSQTALFWQKLMTFRAEGLLSEAIFMGFSLEQLAVSQSCTYSLCNFPLVIPRKRIKFVSPEGQFNSPTHSNVIVYVPGINNSTSRFKEVFKDLGSIMLPNTPAN